MTPHSLDAFLVVDKDGRRSTVLRNIFDTRPEAEAVVLLRASWENAPYSVVGCTVNYVTEDAQ